MCDDQYRLIGYDITNYPIVNKFFSQETINYISKQITILTKGVDERGRDIIVPDDKIVHLMNSVYDSYNPANGYDMETTNQQYFDRLVGQTISQAVFDIRNVLGYEQCVQKYTVWDTVLGDQNPLGMRSHAPVKIRKRRPNSMEFNMKY